MILTQNLEPSWLMEARGYIEKRYRQKLSLAIIAESAGVHPAHLARKFHDCFGTTVGSYIRSLRIEAAIRELEVEQKPVVDIALEAGFYDQSHFHHVFKKHTGLTPAEFVKRRCGKTKPQ